jgi:hypothetical protein
MVSLNSRVSLNFGSESNLNMSFQFVKGMFGIFANLSPLLSTLDIFLNPSNNLLEKRLGILNRNLPHPNTYLGVINNILTTFRHGMFITNYNIRFWQGKWSTRNNNGQGRCEGTQIGTLILHICNHFVQQFILGKQFLQLHNHNNPHCFNNLKNALCDMIGLPIFVDVINNQCKNIKSDPGHP